MINLVTEAMKADPYPTLALLQEKYPVCQVEPGRLWAITRYDDVAFAAKRYDLFSSAATKSITCPQWLSPDCRRGLFVVAEDPPIHTQNRTLINKAFVNQVVNDTIPLMRSAALALIKKMQENPQSEFMEDFSYPFTNKVINSIIGVEDEQDFESIRDWINLLGELTVERPTEKKVEALEKSIRQQVKVFDNIIDDRRKNPRNDFVSQLVNSDNKDLNLTNEMLNNALDILIRASYMTTVHMLGVTVLQLSRRPKLASQLRKHPINIPAFIEELLRLYSPSLCVIRQTTQSVEMRGIIIPENSRVLLYLAAANRDPEIFDNPSELILDRSNQEHLAFGAGPHICIGLALARAELKVVIETILQHTDYIECPEDSDLDWVYSLFMRGLNSLPIRLT